MKRFTRGLIVLAACFLLSPALAYAEFIRVAQVNSGAAQTLYRVLQSVAYQGPPSMDEVTVCNPIANANTLYVGSDSATNASSGVPLTAGSCFTWRTASKPIDSQQIYLFVSVSQNAELTVRQR